MDATAPIAGSIALTMGTAWASGVNLYAAMLALGLMAKNGAIHLPPGLHMLTHPWVIGAAGLMYFLEFFADKVPGIDTAWDILHTFIRIPAGAVLAAGAVGQAEPVAMMAAGLTGGTVAAGAHVIKAGTRVLVNGSPEPFSNWTLSIGEDVAVLGTIWAAVHHPWVFLILFALFLLASLWLIPRLWRGISGLGRRLADIFRRGTGRPVT